jgi:hypothetical protein
MVDDVIAWCNRVEHGLYGDRSSSNAPSGVAPVAAADPTPDALVRGGIALGSNPGVRRQFLGQGQHVLRCLQ